MKKLLVFFICVMVISCGCPHALKFAVASENVNIANNCSVYNLDLGCEDVSLIRKNINALDNLSQVAVINKIMSMGFTLEQALQYVYPNLQSSIENICKNVEISPQEPCVYTEGNNCKIDYKNAKNGVKIDKNALFNDFFDSLQNGGELKIKLIEIKPQLTIQDLEKLFNLVASFETDFSNSKPERKNNIKLAMSSVDGVLIKSGESLSFNKLTGVRSQENGYLSAKIIKNGEYVDGVGGGVCQVSTTLYNACILAGLTVSEVHNHSLPASYVLPGFDAMVNAGSSDLKITNNTKSDFLITTCSNQDKCKVCIFGVKPEYEIRRRYVKYQDLPAKDIIENDVTKFNGEFVAGENRITYPQDGYRVKSYLDYYKNGELIKSEQIRDCTYLPRNGVLLKIDENIT